MRLSVFTERTNTAHIDITDESGDEKLDEIDVTYRPATWTPEFEDRMRGGSGQDWTTNVFAIALSEAVTKWTLTDAVTGPDGTVTEAEVPLSVDRLRQLPSNLLSQVVAGISNDMRPKPKPSGS